MLQSLLGSDPLLRVVDEYPPQEVEHLLVERSVRRNELLEQVSTGSWRMGGVDRRSDAS